jgi:HSP20 family molecular chaperone IbpA
MEDLIDYVIEKITEADKYVKETNTTYDYVIALPGLKREDLQIKAMLEKDFFTILVIVEKITNFVLPQSIRIVKAVKDVVTDKDSVDVKMEDGVLTISLLKTNPITEIDL